MWLPRNSFALLAALVVSATPGEAGTLCGTVRDAQTGSPVAHAGIFLRLPSGDATGINGASAGDGSFCISAIPPATYDLEVLVDHYRVAYVRGVVVTGEVDVTIPATIPPRVELVAPWPNPATGELRLRWVLPRPSAARLRVLDLAGRTVQEWFSTSLPAGAHQIRWDLRDRSGRALPPGCYFAELDAGGARSVRAFRRLQ